jgi:hypothetical protein
MPAPETYQNAWDPALNWVFFYGLGFVAPFYYCPFWYVAARRATPTPLSPARTHAAAASRMRLVLRCRGQCEVAVYSPNEYPGTTKKRKISDLTQIPQVQVSFFDSMFFPEQPDWNTTVDDYPGYQLSMYVPASHFIVPSSTWW